MQTPSTHSPRDTSGAEAFRSALAELVLSYGDKLTDNEVIGALEAQLGCAWADAGEPQPASLFAAAPDLLSELRDAVDLIVQITRSRWSEWEASEEETVGSFRAAIAKAVQS